jgi:hypothetical protein
MIGAQFVMKLGRFKLNMAKVTDMSVESLGPLVKIMSVK